MTHKRMKWDDGLADIKELLRPNKNIQVLQLINKAPLNFKNRDFLDKRVYFKNEGIYYVYISQAPDSVRQ